MSILRDSKLTQDLLEIYKCEDLVKIYQTIVTKSDLTLSEKVKINNIIVDIFLELSKGRQNILNEYNRKY